MVFGKEEAGQGDDHTRQQAENVHKIENAEFSSFVAAKRWLISDIPDIPLQT